MNSTPRPNPHAVFLAQAYLLVWAGTVLHKVVVQLWARWSWFAATGAGYDVYAGRRLAPFCLLPSAPCPGNSPM